MDVVEGMLKNAKEPAWLEQNIVGNFRAWQIIFIAIAGFTTIIVALCCCIRFRVPRTKQQIEADYQRRILTKKFRQQLEKIQNSKMDTIDLKSALDLVRAEFKSDSDSDKEQRPSLSLMSSIVTPIVSASSDDVSVKSTRGINDKKNIESHVHYKDYRNNPSFSSKISALVKMSKKSNIQTKVGQ